MRAAALKPRPSRPVALRRLWIRPSFMQRPDLQAFRQYLRTLAHPSLRLEEAAKEGGGHLASSPLDGARLDLRQMGIAINRESLARKGFSSCSTSVTPRAASAMTCGVGVSGRSRRPRSSANGKSFRARWPGRCWNAAGTGRTLASTCRGPGILGHAPCSSSAGTGTRSTSTSSRRSATISRGPGMPGGTHFTRILPNTDLTHPPVPLHKVRTWSIQPSSINLSAASVSQSGRTARRRYSRAGQTDFEGSAIRAAAPPPQTHSRRGSGAYARRCAARLGFGSRRADIFLRLPRSRS